MAWDGRRLARSSRRTAGSTQASAIRHATIFGVAHDGYIAGPNETGFEHLFEWFDAVDREFPSAKPGRLVTKAPLLLDGPDLVVQGGDLGPVYLLPRQRGQGYRATAFTERLARVSNVCGDHIQVRTLRTTPTPDR